MNLGIDFDNTLVQYEGVFHAVAVGKGLIPQEVSTSKEGVRDYLRACGREDAWTELQGYVYGPGMQQTQPYPGAMAFLELALQYGIRVSIISHRTRLPYLGPPYDLHQSAVEWMERRGFFRKDGIGLSRERVFLEETKEEKLAQIARTQCTHFVDDLPELLLAPGFPQGTERLWFAPGEGLKIEGLRRFSSWQELTSYLLGEEP